MNSCSISTAKLSHRLFGDRSRPLVIVEETLSGSAPSGGIWQALKELA